MENYKDVFGRNIKKIRLEKGFDQTQMADFLDVNSNKTISNWERGKAFPEMDDLLRISHLLGKSLNELVEDTRKVITTDAPQIPDPVKRKSVIEKLQALEGKVLDLANEMAEEKEDRDSLIKKLAEYEDLIAKLKRENS